MQRVLRPAVLSADSGQTFQDNADDSAVVRPRAAPRGGGSVV